MNSSNQLRLSACLALILTGSLPALAQGGGERFAVTVLGSGSPAIRADRMSQSTLVEAGNTKLLFDAGRGVLLRIKQAGIVPAKVSDVFFTHYHSDHTVGFPDFWLTSWLPGGGQRNAALNVYGPTGVVALANGLQKAFSSDIDIRVADQNLDPAGVKMNVTEFGAPGVIYQANGVTVTAFENDHGEKIKPSYGYRIDFDGRSVVLSGDTRRSAEVARQAKGGDLLIHEVLIATEKRRQSLLYKAILAHHTSPEEAGEVFAEAAPKLAVYAHVIQSANPGEAIPSDEELIATTRRTYQGPLDVARDLTRYVITDRVTIERLKPME